MYVCAHVEAKGQQHIATQEQPGFEMEPLACGLPTRLGWDCKRASPHLAFTPALGLEPRSSCLCSKVWQSRLPIGVAIVKDAISASDV